MRSAQQDCNIRIAVFSMGLAGTAAEEKRANQVVLVCNPL